MPTSMMDMLRRNRWSWSAIAVVILWIALSVVSGKWSLSSLSGILVSASFLTLISLGQMLVVTTGRGNIDLSVASVMTLSAFLALIVIQGEDARLPLGLLVTLGLGGGVGLVNAGLVIWLRIPAIIATLATGYVLASAMLIANATPKVQAISPMLDFMAAGRVAGMPMVVVLTVAVVALTALILRHSAWGRKLEALGQNRAAARLAGIAVNRVLVTAFVASSCLASVTGLLLGAYIDGAFLEMGQPYLLQSVAAVVLGGTLIMGGQATALGTFFATILLNLLVTIMQILGLPRGTQDMVQGVVVIAVLALAAQGISRARRHV